MVSPAECLERSVSLDITVEAFPSSVLSDSPSRVAFEAVCDSGSFCGQGISSQEIDPVGNGFQMGWIHTGSVSAQVVYDMTYWNIGTMCCDPGYAVCGSEPVEQSDLSVSWFGESPGPYPAGISELEILEPAFGRDEFDADGRVERDSLMHGINSSTVGSSPSSHANEAGAHPIVVQGGQR